jgi:hypothetical protein
MAAVSAAVRPLISPPAAGGRKVMLLTLTTCPGLTGREAIEAHGGYAGGAGAQQPTQSLRALTSRRCPSGRPRRAVCSTATAKRL